MHDSYFMKLLPFLFCGVLSLTLLTGCGCNFKAQSFVNEIEALVIDAEVNSENWDEKQWQLFDSQLKGMMAGSFEEIQPCLEVTQKKRIEIAHARGKDLLITENPIEGLLDEIKEGVGTLFD